ncbi:MAG: ribonuclease HI family protein [Petrotogales bacterium]
MKQKKIYLYTDGGSRGNPGSAAIGIVVCDENKNIIHKHKECIGEATNNTAEYIALLKGLEMAAGISRNEICCFSDSELLVKQLNGSYRIKANHLRDIYYDIKIREGPFKDVKYNHVKRNNKFIQKCDELVNKALDDK